MAVTINIRKYMSARGEFIITAPRNREHMSYIRSEMKANETEYGFKVGEMQTFNTTPERCFRVIVDEGNTHEPIERFVRKELGKEELAGEEFEARFEPVFIELVEERYVY